MLPSFGCPQQAATSNQDYIPSFGQESLVAMQFLSRMERWSSQLGSDWWLRSLGVAAYSTAGCSICPAHLPVRRPGHDPGTRMPSTSRVTLPVAEFGLQSERDRIRARDHCRPQEAASRAGSVLEI